MLTKAIFLMVYAIFSLVFFLFVNTEIWNLLLVPLLGIQPITLLQMLIIGGLVGRLTGVMSRHQLNEKLDALISKSADSKLFESFATVTAQVLASLVLWGLAHLAT